MKRVVLIKLVVGFTLLFSAVFSHDAMFLRPILDEHGQETGLYDVNPDPLGEPWISGGGRALTDAEVQCIPEFKLAEGYKNREVYPLPTKVDNSRNKYFPPLLSQKGASCCQASGVTYIFSYEMCRVRDLDAKNPKNIYPYGFAYNFINRGVTSTYSSFTDGWRMAEELGMPTLKSYGGKLEGSARQTSWMNGYQLYYQAMQNRYKENYRIKCTTADGIEKMKQWLFDRGDGSKPGGVLGFLAWSGQTRDRLPSTSPEAGHTYVKRFNTSGGHCMTLVGYNDDIEYDMNDDGTIDASEKGGFLLVNSYGTNYGTEGRAYVPYKLFLDGAMKSSNVYGITVLPKLITPKLTFKVTLTHDTRNAIKIVRGFSTNINATTPNKTYRYRECFSDGGKHPMQGRQLSETIELGLDVSHFVKDIVNKQARFFLQIEAKGASRGSVDSFSVIDYTSGQAKEYRCTQTPATITNGTITLSVVGDVVSKAPKNLSNQKGNPSFVASPLTSNGSIHFTYHMPGVNRAQLRILSISGRLLYTKTHRLSQNNEIVWNRRTTSGESVPSGKYIAQLVPLDKKASWGMLRSPFYVTH